MNINARFKGLEDAKNMILVDEGHEVCFTSYAQIAYACSIDIMNVPKIKMGPCDNDMQTITDVQYLNVYLNAEVIDFLSKEELRKRPIFTKEKNSLIEVHVVTVKNTLNQNLLRFKIQRISNVFQYKTFLNGCIINNQLQELVLRKATPHIGLMYFSRFVDMGEISILFGFNESQLRDEIYGFQALEDAGTKSARTYIKEWIALLNEKKQSKEFGKMKNKFDLFIKSFMFRIIYTLHCILLRFPGFRHNDLHLDNIIMDQNDVDAYYETENDLCFMISKLFSFPRIIDFGWSSLLSQQCIQPLGLNMGANHYIDLNKFFNHLFLMFEHDSNLLHPQVWNFIQGVVPEPYRVGFHKSKNLKSELQMSIWSPHSDYMILPNKSFILGTSMIGKPLVEYVKPSQLLMDPVFNVFKVKKQTTGIIFQSLKAL
jgi:hypothetical protein